MSDTPGTTTGPMPVPDALLSRNPIRWLSIFGPGAVIASLTIGVGELVFSSRAGSIFGYRPLWFFLAVLALKWVLVFSIARHMVITGRHPFERWMGLPGPRGWLPAVFFLLAVPCFPIWVCFHAGTVGTLLAGVSGTAAGFQGAAHLVWGLGVLAVVLVLCFTGGYAALERAQLLIVVIMLLSVLVAAGFVNPDWAAFLKGMLMPQPLAYPSWITPATHPEIAIRPLWVELATYVGVVGGSSYDYLAYVSYLRDKGWGRAGNPADASGPAGSAPWDRRWLRAPLIDCTLSFAVVFVFCAVFVVCGAAVLGPQQKIPAGSNLLALQAEFVTAVHPWLKHVYFLGAFLAVFGTLYGTIEVAPTLLREMAVAWRPLQAPAWLGRLRTWAVAWCGLGGAGILVWSLFHHLGGGQDRPPGLIAILTPANLFTGVLGCGIICGLTAWLDRRAGPDRLPVLLVGFNLVAAATFAIVGFKGAWDDARWRSLAVLAASIAIGIGVAALGNRPRRTRDW